MVDYKTILLEILTAIDYADDKEAFVAEFIKNIQLQSFYSLIDALPTDKFEELKSKLSSVSNDSEKVSEIVKGYFSENLMQHSLQNAAKDAITNCLTTIDNTLSEVQREALSGTMKKYTIINLHS